MEEFEQLAFASQAAWERWLAKHHASARGVWVKFAKKGSGVRSVNYAEALEGALCYGWIDGLVRRLDETHYLQRFTPRTKRSKWSKINRGKAEALIAAGRMREAGLMCVEAARADGRWAAAYDSPSTVEVPEELRAALAKDAKARAFFETLKGRDRYAILYRIHDAKRPETRARRVAEYVAMLGRGERPDHSM